MDFKFEELKDLGGGPNLLVDDADSMKLARKRGIHVHGELDHQSDFAVAVNGGLKDEVSH
jgi:hypothetical protein